MARSYKIVIDTNVLVSGLRSNRGASYKLLSIIGNEVFEFCISAALVIEYESVLKRTHLIELKPEIIDDIIDYICLKGTKTEIFYLWRPVLKDPKDDFILELAVNSNSKFVITFNKKHFVGIEKFGIAVLNPKEFLQKIGELK